MKNFSIRIAKDTNYTKKIIGETVRIKETNIIITNIVNVEIEEEYIVIQGYGIITE